MSNTDNNRFSVHLVKLLKLVILGLPAFSFGQCTWPSAIDLRGAGIDYVGGLASGPVTSGNVDSVVYLTGRVTSQPTWQGQPLPDAGFSFYLARMLPGGRLDWFRNSNFNAFGQGTAIAVDPDRGPVVAGFYESEMILGLDSAVNGPDTLKAVGAFNMFVAAYSPAGALRWAKSLHLPETSGAGRADAIAIGQGGNIYVGGWFEGSLAGNGDTIREVGGSDAFVACLAADGQVRWMQSMSGPGGERCLALAAGDSGHFYMSGLVLDTAQFGGQIFAPFGYLLKADSNGKVLWSAQKEPGSGRRGDFEGQALIRDENGALYFSAQFGPDQLVFAGDTLSAIPRPGILTAKFNAGGRLLWRQVVYGLQGTSGRSTLVLDDGVDGLYMAGNHMSGDLVIGGMGGAGGINGTVDTLDADDQGGLVVQLDPRNGAIGQYCLTGNGTALGLALGADGLYVAGQFSDSMSLGSVVFSRPGNGLADVYVGRLTQLPLDRTAQQTSPYGKRFEVFPVPHAGSLTIRPNFLPHEPVSLKIYSLEGKVVSSYELPPYQRSWRIRLDAASGHMNVLVLHSPEGYAAFRIMRE